MTGHESGRGEGRSGPDQRRDAKAVQFVLGKVSRGENYRQVMKKGMTFDGSDQAEPVREMARRKSAKLGPNNQLLDHKLETALEWVWEAQPYLNVIVHTS
jgi:hypothetical protein